MANLLSSKPLYVPILKWKMGEQTAVQALTPEVKGLIFPVAEIQDRPFDWENDRYTKEWDDHLVAISKATAKRWGSEHELAVAQPIENDDRTKSGQAVWEFLFSQLWQDSIQAVPVVSSSASPSEFKALVNISRQAGRDRFVLRYEHDPASTNTASSISEWFRVALKQTGSTHRSVDALIDVRYLAANSLISASFCADIASAVALQGPWRTVSLAAGSFPENLTGMMPGVHRVPRRDWSLYREVNHLTGGKYSLLFGDYGVNYTDTLETDPRLMRMSANLRYTYLDEWFVFRAKNVKDHGFGQYRDLCSLLVNSNPPYMGPAFSAADTNYEAVANNPNVGPGNATVWRRDATNHHIHLVISQLRERV